MALSSNRIGHRPFTAAMPGSNPAGVTTSSPQAAHPSLPARRFCRRAESSLVPLRLLSPCDPLHWARTGTPNGCVAQMASAPACHAGGRGFEPRHGRHVGVPSARLRNRNRFAPASSFGCASGFLLLPIEARFDGGPIRPLRLTGQDGSLSSCKCGFESRRGHQYGSVLKW